MWLCMCLPGKLESGSRPPSKAHLHWNVKATDLSQHWPPCCPFCWSPWGLDFRVCVLHCLGCDGPLDWCGGILLSGCQLPKGRINGSQIPGNAYKILHRPQQVRTSGLAPVVCPPNTFRQPRASYVPWNLFHEVEGQRGEGKSKPPKVWLGGHRVGGDKSPPTAPHPHAFWSTAN